MVVKITSWKNGRILFHMTNNPTQNSWISFMFFARGWIIPYPIHWIETIKDCEVKITDFGIIIWMTPIWNQIISKFHKVMAFKNSKSCLILCYSRKLIYILLPLLLELGADCFGINNSSPINLFFQLIR